ncbi:MAG: DUF2244 domain-containing protein [Gammaproteobacteria bacterium]|nr:DUF2244 domain-containing protein [Gammaproteobacteria bacterium]
MASDDSTVTRIVVQRNQSITGRGLAFFLAVGSIPSLVFVGFAIFGGWWPIVGFCLGVLLLLAVALYVVLVAANEREVITVMARHIVVESGRTGPRMRVRLERYWARVEPSDNPSAALTLSSRGVAVEIAAALSAPERKLLARRLASLIGPHARSQVAGVAGNRLESPNTGCSRP